MKITGQKCMDLNFNESICEYFPTVLCYKYHVIATFPCTVLQTIQSPITTRWHKITSFLEWGDFSIARATLLNGHPGLRRGFWINLKSGPDKPGRFCAIHKPNSVTQRKRWAMIIYLDDTLLCHSLRANFSKRITQRCSCSRTGLPWSLYC